MANGMVEIYFRKDVIPWSELSCLAEENIDRIFISYGKRKWVTRFTLDEGILDNAWHINVDGRIPDYTIVGQRGTKSATAEEFIAYLEDKYPQDLEWMLFHTEIFGGTLYLDDADYSND